MSEIELKACPFCGNAASMETTTDPQSDCNCVRCDECDFDLMGGPIGIGWWPSESAAAEAWNRRAEADALREGIAKALDELEDDGPKAVKYAAQELRAVMGAEA